MNSFLIISFSVCFLGLHQLSPPFVHAKIEEPIAIPLDDPTFNSLLNEAISELNKKPNSTIQLIMVVNAEQFKDEYMSYIGDFDLIFSPKNNAEMRCQLAFHGEPESSTVNVTRLFCYA